jgi:hypothetical protein
MGADVSAVSAQGAAAEPFRLSSTFGLFSVMMMKEELSPKKEMIQLLRAPEEMSALINHYPWMVWRLLNIGESTESVGDFIPPSVVE